MHTSITEAMTAEPTTVGPDATTQEAARTMKSENVGSLPIVEDGRLVGLVTDRDITIRVVAEGKSRRDAGRPDRLEGGRLRRPAAEPRRGGPADGRAPGTAPARCEEDGKLVGILAQADVATSGHDSLTGETVQKISQ